MVNNALNLWRGAEKSSPKVTFPHSSWLDLAAYCYLYDFGPFNVTDQPEEEREHNSERTTMQQGLLYYGLVWISTTTTTLERVLKKDANAGPTCLLRPTRAPTFTSVPRRTLTSMILLMGLQEMAEQ